ncbi:MAG: methyltransferase domain-containing protein [Betaproteobacteria bacterium]|nr:methyltransferase domain-containing protein [Betaproteobacteria bacterium]
MRDNVTAHSAKEFDAKVSATIPFYDLFHQQTIDLVRSVNESPQKWLDIGCGTGNLYLDAKKYFPGTEFTLADPSQEMLVIARKKTATNGNPAFILSDSQNLDIDDNVFDVITAIQSHHYQDEPARKRALENCFRMLAPGGVFVVFENIRPLSEKALPFALKRWENYQTGCGRTATEARAHIKRFDNEYFPISITEHLRLLNEIGFSIVELLWASYMQAGFYAIKCGSAVG